MTAALPPVQPPPDTVRDTGTMAQQYRPRLMRYFRNHLGSVEDAEDLTQETLVRMMRDPQADRVNNVEAYLMTIAGNLLRDRYRRDRTRHTGQHVPLDETTEDWPTETVSGERVYQDRERLRNFLKVLDDLPPRCQQVFLLHRYEGLTYRAIASQLGISVSAVEKQMMRALLHFGTRLEQP
ncbi:MULTISPECIES: sigma-70 family RNA polymerase sigma factor [Stenotrophomonas]|uniref:RNA polymerase sigma factor n=1 Tax=Stenotrophomonas TaxID=40323 RepID=UPI0007701FE8|nr:MULTISPECIES: sigma-70 family RNA polymerase sigma factor [Stenotrophomonas]AMJ56010.1 hypothetical protein AXG53_04670 [Stenotrophomonas sp. KCTC 12332]